MENGSDKTQVEMPVSGQDSNSGPGITISETPRKRGRPPGSKNSGTPIDTGHTTKSRVKVDPTPDTLEAAKFIGVGFVSLLELFESFVHSNGAKKIEKKMPDKLAEFRMMCEEVGLQAKEKDLIQDTVQRIAARYEFMTKYAPELVLGVTLAQYGVRQMSLLSFVDKMTKEVKEVKLETVAVKSAA